MGLSKQKQQGFTLIELVVVIVILGILAAFAVPRFIDINRDAREAAVKGLAGSMRSANALIHGLAMARGLTGATGSVSLEGTAVALKFGYPDVAGIAAALTNTSGFVPTTVGTMTTFVAAGITTDNDCEVEFVEATSATAPPTITLKITATGCS